MTAYLILCWPLFTTRTSLNSPHKDFIRPVTACWCGIWHHDPCTRKSFTAWGGATTDLIGLCPARPQVLDWMLGNLKAKSIAYMQTSAIFLLLWHFLSEPALTCSAMCLSLHVAWPLGPHLCQGTMTPSPCQRCTMRGPLDRLWLLQTRNTPIIAAVKERVWAIPLAITGWPSWNSLIFPPPFTSSFSLKMSFAAVFIPVARMKR